MGRAREGILRLLLENQISQSQNKATIATPSTSAPTLPSQSKNNKYALMNNSDRAGLMSSLANNRPLINSESGLISIENASISSISISSSAQNPSVQTPDQQRAALLAKMREEKPPFMYGRGGADSGGIRRRRELLPQQ